MNIIRIINATTIPDAWYWTLFDICHYGYTHIISEGSFAGNTRTEIIAAINIRYPGCQPVIPEIPPCLNLPTPVSQEYIDKYYLYLVTQDKQPNETYTYGERIAPHLEYLANKITNSKEGCNQYCLEVAQPTDVYLPDPPCLRLLDFQIFKNSLNLYTYWRSWDAWGGMPANLAALQKLKSELASLIGVNDGELTAFSKSLHLYSHELVLAEKRISYHL